MKFNTPEQKDKGRGGPSSYHTLSNDEMQRLLSKGASIEAVRVLPAYLTFRRQWDFVYPGDAKVCEAGYFDQDVLDAGRAWLLEYGQMVPEQRDLKSKGIRHGWKLPKVSIPVRNRKQRLETPKQRSTSKTLSNDMIQLYFLDGGTLRGLSLLSALLVYRNLIDGRCFPTNRQILDLSGLPSEKAIEKSIDDLVATGWLHQGALEDGFDEWEVREGEPAKCRCFVFKTLETTDIPQVRLSLESIKRLKKSLSKSLIRDGRPSPIGSPSLSSRNDSPGIKRLKKSLKEALKTEALKSPKSPKPNPEEVLKVDPTIGGVLLEPEREDYLRPVEVSQRGRPEVDWGHRTIEEDYLRRVAERFHDVAEVGDWWHRNRETVGGWFEYDEWDGGETLPDIRCFVDLLEKDGGLCVGGYGGAHPGKWWTVDDETGTVSFWDWEEELNEVAMEWSQAHQEDRTEAISSKGEVSSHSSSPSSEVGEDSSSPGDEPTIRRIIREAVGGQAGKALAKYIVNCIPGETLTVICADQDTVEWFKARLSPQWEGGTPLDRFMKAIKEQWGATGFNVVEQKEVGYSTDDQWTDEDFASFVRKIRLDLVGWFRNRDGNESELGEIVRQAELIRKGDTVLLKTKVQHRELLSDVLQEAEVKEHIEQLISKIFKKPLVIDVWWPKTKGRGIEQVSVTSGVDRDSC